MFSSDSLELPKVTMGDLIRLDQARSKLRIDPTGRIRVVFEADLDGGLTPHFECLSCSDLLEWWPFRNWFACPSCHYELTPEEARIVLEQAEFMLGKLERLASKGVKGWGLLRFLRKALRLSGL